MEITRHQITVPKTAHYALLGEPGAATRQVWIVVHGYGQLSGYFIRKFQHIANTETVVVAPEGLHRYYLNGHSGRVGASWMTREDRLVDIADYCRYLDLLADSLLAQMPQAKITVLGFSQGGATACRWVARTRHKIDHLVLWGSVTPPDMNWEEEVSALRHQRWFHVTGTQDEFIRPEQVEEQLTLLKNQGIPVEALQYEGGHDIHEATLQALAERIAATY